MHICSLMILIIGCELQKKYPIYVMQERLLAMRRFIHENSEVENNSKTYGPNVIRYENEAANIKRHFLRIWKMNCLSEHSGRILNRVKYKEELECEKIFLLCKTCPELQNILPTGLDNFFGAVSEVCIRNITTEI